MIHIGTAGYSYKDWKGPFYPEDIKDTQMLEFYALHFGFVEVNSSYYHMPRLQLFESLNKKTPDSFRFAVKLFGGFTHERSSGQAEAEKFMYSIKPLVESGKLICVLAQFPYSFHYKSENVEHIKRLRQWFGDVELSVEFRNQNWIRGEVVALLKSEEVGFVCVDEPGIKGLIKNVVVSTSKVSYVRMHGRNADKWYSGEGNERYNYLYSRDELIEWVSRLKELDRESSYTVVSFNNHPLGKAVENARMMMNML